MYRRIFGVLVIFILAASITGCSWMKKTLNPTFSADFDVMISSRVEHRQLTNINGVPQDQNLIPPDSLAVRIVVTVEVKDLDYWGSDGNQDRPFEAVITASLFDVETGTQSVTKIWTNARSDRTTYFTFSDADFR